MSQWDAIRALQSELRQVQESDVSQRLSERNVIELVTLLLEQKFVELVFTRDGKEYVTPAKILLEIEEQIKINGGRIALSQLSDTLNLDYSNIEAKANELLQRNRHIKLVLGELVTDDYSLLVAKHFNDRLVETGRVSVADVVAEFDISTDYINSVVSQHIGTVIQGIRDASNRDLIYTEAYLCRFRSRIRGALEAAALPVTLTSLSSTLHISHPLLLQLTAELVKGGCVAGAVSGDVYTPAVYSKAQQQWAVSSFTANDYVDFQALRRVGITDCSNFAKRSLQALVLSNCAISTRFKEDLQQAFDDTSKSGGWCDVTSLLPSAMTEGEVRELVSKCPAAGVFEEVGVGCYVSVSFMSAVTGKLEVWVKEKAEEYLKQRPHLLSGAAATAAPNTAPVSGKSVKKGGAKKKAASKSKPDVGEQSGSDSLNDALEPDVVEEVVTDAAPDFPCHAELASALIPRLADQLSAHVTTLVKEHRSEKTKTPTELLQKINSLYSTATLINKGVIALDGPLQAIALKHVLQTFCGEMLNTVLTVLALDYLSELTTTHFNNESRTKFIKQLPAKFHAALLELNQKLVDVQSVQDWLDAFGDVVLAFDISLPRIDKKKEKTLALEQLADQRSQVESQTDPATLLHLATLIKFQVATGYPLALPSKAVPQLITWFASSPAAIPPAAAIPPETMNTLRTAQLLVVSQLRSPCDENERKLVELTPQLRAVAGSPV